MRKKLKVLMLFYSPYQKPRGYDYKEEFADPDNMYTEKDVSQALLSLGHDVSLLGIFNDTAYYLLYNGILGDRRPQSGNVLTQTVLDGLPAHQGRRIIYGEACRFGKQRLEAENILFKQIPYDVRAA